MALLPDNVRKYLDTLQEKMDAAQHESHVDFLKYQEERDRVRASYPLSSYNAMYKKYAKPYLDKSDEQYAIYETLFCHCEFIKAFPWGQQEP